MADDQTTTAVETDGDTNVTVKTEAPEAETPTPRDIAPDDQNQSNDSEETSETDLPKWARDAISKANREAAGYRDRAKAAEAEAKAKADSLAQYEALANASKSESEKQADRIAALEKSLKDAETARQRSAIQARFGLSDEVAADILDGDDIEKMERRAARYAELTTAAKKVTAPVPAEGRRNPVPDADPLRQFAREVFSNK